MKAILLVLIVTVFGGCKSHELMTTREYKISPSFLDTERPGNDGEELVVMAKHDPSESIDGIFIEFLKKTGVTFEKGSNLTIDTNQFTVTIRNTEVNHEAFEKVFDVRTSNSIVQRIK
jgi:hypothetical protein